MLIRPFRIKFYDCSFLVREATASLTSTMITGSALLFGNRQVIFERTAALGLPAIYQWSENAHEGGLIGYGPSEVGNYERQLSRMAAEILRGTKPADIPIEHPTPPVRAARRLVKRASGCRARSMRAAGRFWAAWASASGRLTDRDPQERLN